jgi:hypothetical protein
MIEISVTQNCFFVNLDPNEFISRNSFKKAKARTIGKNCCSLAVQMYLFWTLVRECVWTLWEGPPF